MDSNTTSASVLNQIKILNQSGLDSSQYTVWVKIWDRQVLLLD